VPIIEDLTHALTRMLQDLSVIFQFRKDFIIFI
jgi:hypothetical protein